MWPPQKKKFQASIWFFFTTTHFCCEGFASIVGKFCLNFGRKIMRKTPINSIIQSIPTHDFVDDWIILDCIVDWSFSYDLFKG